MLEGGKELGAHVGDWRGVLRFQLVLEQPPDDGGDCWIGIGTPFGTTDDSIVLPMEQGNAYVFDDTYIHMSVNKRRGRRVNLFLDLPRHDFPWYFQVPRPSTKARKPN